MTNQVTPFTSEHPECAPNEVYLGNVIAGTFQSAYKTLRYGVNAYMLDGTPYPYSI